MQESVPRGTGEALRGRPARPECNMAAATRSTDFVRAES
jgi:hypothetical protein